jgi:hypothetical protein
MLLNRTFASNGGTSINGTEIPAIETGKATSALPLQGLVRARRIRYGVGLMQLKPRLQKRLLVRENIDANIDLF